MSSAGSAVREAPRVDAGYYYPWNFWVLQVDVCTFIVGLAFLDGTTVLPLLLDRLGATSAVIGAMQACQTLGMNLPALFAAHRIHGRRRHQRFLVGTCALGRAGLLTMPPVLLFWGQSHPGWVLVWFFLVYAFFWLMDGACHVSWMDIIGKTIPARARGRLFGTIQVVGGLGAATAGWVVSGVLASERLPFPRNFALLILFWCAGAAVSQVALMLLREPDGAASTEEKPPLRVYLARTPAFLRANPHVAQIIGIRLLLGAASLSLPFYILFARRHLGVPDAMVGVYLTVQRVGEIATGALWGYLSDRFGPALGLRMVAAGVVATPLMALLATYGLAGCYPAVFLLLGATLSAVWILANNALLEVVADHDRPMAVGVASICQTPIALYALLGGVLLRVGLSYPGLFILTLLVTGLGFGATLRFSGASRAQTRSKVGEG